MSTASRFIRLARILETPFGPYNDTDALTPKCKSTPMNPLQLESLEMHATYAGERRRVGLDMTQTAVIFPADPKPEEVVALKRLYPVNVRHLPAIPAKTPIEFTGVLVLANTKHIQEDVSEAIQNEIRRRLRQAKVASHGNPWTEVLFAEDGRPLRDDPKLRVRILIRGNIHKPASFNVASPDGNGRILRISTLDRSRSYRVVSMHVATYDLSRTYLLRWRVQAAIEDIYTEDRKKRKGKGKGKDTAHLTPQFYIDQYLRRHRKHFEDILRWRRTLGLPGADEPAPGTEEPPLEAEAYPLGTLTLTPRSMRHVHRFEIAHCFGAHVEWLIAQAHARRQVRALDWESWLKFADVTLEERKKSALARRDEFNGNEANPGPLPERETRIDLRALLDSRGKLERARATAGNAMEVDSEEEDVGFDIFMESGSEESDDFDSDHYETSPSEHSSDDEGIEPWHGLSPEMDAVLHPSFFVPPHLGDDFMYDCFVEGCDFHVNLRFLSEEDTHALEPGWWTHYHPSAVEPGKVAIRAKQQFLQRVLSRLVAKHYFVHLRELDIKMVQKKGLGLVPEWLHPERHEEWPPRHLLEARAYHNSL